MVHFVGAGPGAPDLITVRGKELLEQADIIIYAGSLVNPELLSYAGSSCKIYDSSRMTLEEVIDVICKAHAQTEEPDIVRLHTGDPSIYGAIREQMDRLDELEIAYDDCPGVSSFCGTAAALQMEYAAGIYIARCITKCNYNQNGRQNPCPCKRRYRFFCAASGYYGSFPEFRNGGTGTGGTSKRRIFSRYAGRSCI